MVAGEGIQFEEKHIVILHITPQTETFLQIGRIHPKLTKFC